MSDRPSLYDSNFGADGPRRRRALAPRVGRVCGMNAGTAPELSIVILSWNTCALTIRCVEEALRATCADPSLPTSEIIVVDNGSSDGTARALAQRFSNVEVVALPANVGFAAGANRGIARANGAMLLLLNSDALIDAKAVRRCLDVLGTDDAIAVVAPQLLSESGRPANSVHAFPSLATECVPAPLRRWLGAERGPHRRRPGSRPRPVEAVLGAALFMRGSALREVGGFCEDYFFYLEETDLCFRLSRAGFRVVFVPDAFVTHIGGASSKLAYPVATRIEFNRSLDLFFRRHRGRAVAAAVRWLRALRAVVGALLSALPARVSPAVARRHRARVGFALWHLRGRPPAAGLAHAQVAATAGQARNGDGRGTPVPVLRPVDSQGEIAGVGAKG